ncbi:MAG: signal recognition particle protein [Alphaproteobacteria bacterium]|nr:MAG: signal recognition particle protein [Alphaproteobacteria bacterium]
MFNALSDKLGSIFDRLKGRGALRAEDVEAAMREVRIALLEADVSLPAVKDFIAKVQSRAVGVDVLQSITPGQQVVKIVHDALVELLSGEDESAELNINVAPPAVILMAGLQGSGKTTTSGKIAKFLNEKRRKKVLLASLDIYRPAAQQQLEILARQVGVGGLPIVTGEKPLQIAERAMKVARIEGYDVLILDSAGRLQIDQELMDELRQVSDLVKPQETLLVADALTGQEALNIARGFNAQIGITGIVLTRMDGDARGGAALSMRHETGRAIKFIGTGEKLDGLQEFDAKRVAGRILGMGDVVGLVEKAMQEFDEAKAEKMMQRMQEGKFDLTDMLDQFRKMQNMGGMGAMLEMLPGMGKIKNQVAGKIDEKMLKRNEAIILSMTPSERSDPDLLKASRKKRIAAGSGTRVEDINRLLKSYEEMSKVMKQIKKGGLAGLLKGGLGQMFGGGGMPGMPDIANIDPKSLMQGGQLPQLPKGLGLPPGFKIPKF